MMESEVLAHKAPLYGRRTGQILLKPFSFYVSFEIFQWIIIEKRLQFFL